MAKFIPMLLVNLEQFQAKQNHVVVADRMTLPPIDDVCGPQGSLTGGIMDSAPKIEDPPQTERLAYSVQEAADMLGVNYFSVYRLIQRGKLLVPRTELLRLLKTE